MKNHYKIIFNPAAGKGKASSKLSVIESFLRKNHMSYEILETRAVGHGEELAREHVSEDHVITVAAGGDGTCNEVINGLMAGRDENTPCFAVLPVGRGNDFSYGGKIPSNLDDALEILKEGKTSPMDVGFVKGGDYPRGRYFGNGIGIGFDTVVGLEAAKMNHVHDTLAYVLGAGKTLIKFSDAPLVEISWGDTSRSLRAIQISLMNGRRMGGLFHMTPKADNRDGMLDMCMVEQQTRRRLIKLIAAYTKGTQEGMAGVTMDREKSFHIKALEGGLTVHADGETICLDGNELDVSCIASPLRIIHKH